MTDADARWTEIDSPDDLSVGDVLTNTSRKPARGTDARTFDVVGFEVGKGFGGDKTDTVVEPHDGRGSAETITEKHLSQHWEVRR